MLYRAHYLTRTVEDVFIKAHIPYTIYSGVQFFERTEIKDALAYLRMIVYRDDLSFLRIVNVPKRNIGEKRMAGFAAGCYLRGIRYVQMPTTFLSAVDSSVGGKTAVNLSAGKNLAGLFVRPEAVICDVDCLKLLPENVFADGAAEAIKTGVLSGEELFSILENGNVRASLPDIIEKCITFKGSIVEADEFESGCRRLLNLGHTVGHAAARKLNTGIHTIRYLWR